MGWIFLTVFAAILFWACIGVWIWAKDRDNDLREQGRDPGSENLMPAFAGIAGAGLVVVLWLGITLAMSVKTVGEREVGIVYNFTGTIAGKRDKGWVTIAPWHSHRRFEHE